MDPGFVPQILALELGGSASLEDELDPLSMRQGDGVVPVADQAEIVTVRADSDPGIAPGKIVGDSEGVVSRAIIDDKNLDVRGGLCEDAVEASREVWRAIVGWDADAHGRCHIGRGPAERGEQRLPQGCMVDVSAKDRGERRSGGALVPPWSTSREQSPTSRRRTGRLGGCVQ